MRGLGPAVVADSLRAFHPKPTSAANIRQRTANCPTGEKAVHSVSPFFDQKRHVSPRGPVALERRMSDTRAAIRELRTLSEKRSLGALSEGDAARWLALRRQLGLPSRRPMRRPPPPRLGTDGGDPGAVFGARREHFASLDGSGSHHRAFRHRAPKSCTESCGSRAGDPHSGRRLGRSLTRGSDRPFRGQLGRTLPRRACLV